MPFAAKVRPEDVCVELAMAMLGVKYTDYEKKYLTANRPIRFDDDDSRGG